MAMTFTSRTCVQKEVTDLTAMFQFTRKSAESYNVNLLLSYQKGAEANCRIKAIRFIDSKVSPKGYGFTEIKQGDKARIIPIVLDQTDDYCIPIPWGASFDAMRVYVEAGAGATGSLDLNINDGGRV